MGRDRRDGHRRQGDRRSAPRIGLQASFCLSRWGTRGASGGARRPEQAEMIFTLLLADSRDAVGAARPVTLHPQVLQTSPGGEDVTVSFRPNRADDLYVSAKSAAQLAYRILFREGIVRSQLVVRFKLGDEAPPNVMGRSADLLFALAMLLSVYEENGQGVTPARVILSLAATGVLEADGTVRTVDHLASKLEAACSAFDGTPATIFFPAHNAAEVDLETLSQRHPKLQLRAIGHLDQALEELGIVLERVYLRNPFRGLEYFDYEHRAIFFGRDAEIRNLAEQLVRREAAGVPGVLVEGASGSGKSSFMRAGLLPALVSPSSQASNVAETLRRRPVRKSLSRAIWGVGHLSIAANEAHITQSILDCWRALPEFAGSLPATCESLAVLADERQKRWPLTQRFVWLIDQLEELFALGFQESVVEALGRFLVRLQSEGVWTLACIRADTVPLLKQRPTFREVFGTNEGQYYLETMSGTALDDVISRPAEVAGLTFGVAPSGQALDQVLREELYATRENILPLLQFTLQELYQRRSGTELRYETYEELGSLSGSVATAAEAALQADLVQSETALPRIFRSLVSVDDEGRASKRYAPVAEIASVTAQRTLLERLVSARLCVTDQHDGSAVVAFAHEALLRTWPRLRDWLTQEGALLQARDLLIAEARRWQQHGERRDWLVTSSDRLAANRRIIEADIPLPEVARRFAEQSAIRARRATRVRQLAVLSLAVLAIAASGAGWIASRKQHEAEHQAGETLKAQSRLLVDAADERLNKSDVAGAQGIILEVLTNPDFGHGRTQAAISVFQEIRAADTQLAVLSGHSDIVRSAAYSPDGTRIVTASHDKTARIWDARTGAPLFVLSGHGDTVRSATYSPDGTRIVTASADKTARIWDARTGAPLALLSGHGDWVRSAAYSPDGTRIVTASDDRTARIWDARTGAPLAVLSGHHDVVYTAAYSPDGTRIVTASADKTARIWDARTGAPLALLSG